METRLNEGGEIEIIDRVSARDFIDMKLQEVANLQDNIAKSQQRIQEIADELQALRQE
jgi:hypothetical protein